MLGHVGLDQAAARNQLAAGAPRHLIEKLKRTFGRARVGMGKAEVGVDHADQCKTRKVMALSHELRADDDVYFPILDGAQGLAKIAPRLGSGRSTEARGAHRERGRQPPRRCARCLARTARANVRHRNWDRSRGSARRCRNGGIRGGGGSGARPATPSSWGIRV